MIGYGALAPRGRVASAGALWGGLARLATEPSATPITGTAESTSGAPGDPAGLARALASLPDAPSAAPIFVLPWGADPAAPGRVRPLRGEWRAVPSPEAELQTALRATGARWGLLTDGARWRLRCLRPRVGLERGIDLDLVSPAPELQQRRLSALVRGGWALASGLPGDAGVSPEAVLAAAQAWTEAQVADLLGAAGRLQERMLRVAPASRGATWRSPSQVCALLLAEARGLLPPALLLPDAEAAALEGQGALLAAAGARLFAATSLAPPMVELFAASAELRGLAAARDPAGWARARLWEPTILGPLHETLAAEEDRAQGRERGRFYTPPALAAALLDASLGEWRAAGGQGPPRLLDPAMGAGQFLAEALELYVEQAPWALALGPAPRSAALRRGLLQGVDLDAGAAALAEMVLWLQAGDPGLRFDELRPWLRHGDSLRRAATAPAGRQLFLDLGSPKAPAPDSAAAVAAAAKDPPAAGPGDDLAQRWALPEEPGGGFDLVVGNPPYLGERGHQEALRDARAGWLGSIGGSRADLWYFFAELAARLLRPGGVHAFLVPSYWRTATGAEALRRRLLDDLRLRELLELGEGRAFARAQGLESVIYVAVREVPSAVAPASPTRPPARAARARPGELSALELTALRLAAEGSLPGSAPLLTVAAAGGAPLLVAASGAPLRAALLRGGALRLPATALRQGVVPNPARGAPPGGGDERGVFALTDAELASLGPLSATEQDLCVPLALPRDLPALAAPRPSLFLLYLSAATCTEERDVPRLIAHLAPWRARLEQRREVQQGRCAWFHLHWPRQRDIFEQPGLLIPRQCLAPRACRSAGGVWVDLGSNVLQGAAAEGALGWPLLALGALLHSRAARYWWGHFGKRKGKVYQLDRGPLAELPLPRPRPAELRRLERVAAAIEQDGWSDEARAEVDGAAEELYGLSEAERAALAAADAEEPRRGSPTSAEEA